MSTYLKIPSQGVDHLLGADVVIDEDVLAVSDRVQRLLEPDALSLHVLPEGIGVRLSGLSLNRLARVDRRLAYKLGQGRDFRRVQDPLDRLGRRAGGHCGQLLYVIAEGVLKVSGSGDIYRIDSGRWDLSVIDGNRRK